MLLERAFALVDDMRAARIPADAAVWNALVTAAGRAGQLQRAFNFLEVMLDGGTRPNDRTYASLIDACARAGDKELALRVYRKAQREGLAATLMVYSSAVSACMLAHGGCDIQAALGIYADMQRCARGAVWRRGGWGRWAVGGCEVVGAVMGWRGAAQAEAAGRSGERPAAPPLLRSSLPADPSADSCCACRLHVPVCVCVRCRAGVEPDSQFYGMMMLAAGRAGDLDLVTTLHGEMEAEGLRSCEVGAALLCPAGGRLVVCGVR